MKLRIALIILLTSIVALACGLLAACAGETHVHDFKLITAQTEPTCTEAGWGLYRCDCGKETEKEIPELDHDWGDWMTVVPANCTDDGVFERMCKHDGSHIQNKTTPALGHDWGEWVTVVPENCESKGVSVRVCKNDVSHFEDQTVPAFGHDWKVIDSQQPTCMEDGYERLVCLTDSTHTERRVLSATGHKYGEWETVVEPGCFTVGAEERSCEYGDDTQSRIIHESEHKYINGVCTECGRKNWDILDITDVDLYSSNYGVIHLSLEMNILQMQELYTLIEADAREYHNGAENSEILGTYDYAELGLTFEEAVTVWKAFMDDHPLYYWLGRTVEYGETLTVPVDTAYTNPDVRAEYNKIIYETAAAWRSTEKENAYLSALSYHDKIIYAVDYAYLADGRTPQTASWAHNIIGVFTGRGAVCEGYARAFQLMLNMTGIANVFVTGTSNEQPHAWNLVKLNDGQWYWFDLTYDDVPGWLWGIRYNYFAVSETQNVNWRDSAATYGPTITFPDTHTPDSGTGAHYMPALPERSQTDYKGAGELLLRETFTLGGTYTYALVGYRAVQLVNCTATGAIYIPPKETYKGTTYEVISVGSIKENGLFPYMGDNVFHGKLTTLYIPRTVRYLFETGVPDGYYHSYGSLVEAFEVDEDNQYFTSVDGVLFTKNMYTLVSYPGGSPRTEYRIPDNVVYLAYHAFTVNTDNLRSLTIGSGLAAAGNANWGYGWLQDAHTGSHNFVESWFSLIYTLKNLEEIKVSEDNVYYSAENGMLFNKDKTQLITVLFGLTEVVVPSTVTVVKADAFFYSSKLTRLVFEGDALQSVAGAFGNNHHLEEIVFGGTREQWDAVKKQGFNGRPWDELVGVSTPDGTYTLICLGDL